MMNLLNARAQLVRALLGDIRTSQILLTEDLRIYIHLGLGNPKSSMNGSNDQ